MSAFAEFEREKQQIDAILTQGYRIAAIEENLDGALVHFVQARPEQERTQLQILTADARKYVTTLLFASQVQTTG
ncbi:hypothetical protein [Paenibacillus campi]|uniref:hypothetical protein n=1 Tax=Paenibacillus campi TaxID=3106031 RepID=UPI002AFE6E45|nr:hypothetical protein [Paenibacillus sp. SGZ-1009]